MKGLNKGKGFQNLKKQQKKQDSQQVLNEVQQKCIANQVGIAQEQILSFKWFFDQLSKFKLPSQYQKQINQKKTIVSYYDRTTKQTTNTHPLINLIRAFFYTQYKSNRSTFTFTSKQEKLLPYVQEKMMKNCISLNSKRRQVQKINVQKDQNGKIVLSKMARVKPDTKNLISARSYMLKMLIQKVYTSKQIWGKGKRAKAFANILNEKQKGIDDDQDQKQDTPQDLQTYQTIFTQASKFYEEQFRNLTKIPDEIIFSQAYKNSTPENVLRNIFLLNISKNQIEFYWFARLMDCLPIPHNWSVNLTSNIQGYIYEPLKLKFDIHPSYIYIVKQMNTFKDYFNSLGNDIKVFYYKDKQMTFYDFFQRQYTVDMYGLALKEELKSQILEQKTQNKQDNNLQLIQQYSNDWMIVQGIINSGIKPQQFPLIEKLCDFWRLKNFNDEEWIPAVSPFGQVIWSSTVNYSSIDYCPYKQILTSKLEIERNKLPILQKSNFKQHIQHQINIEEGNIKMDQNSQTAVQFNNIDNERNDFLFHYLSQVNKQNQIPYNVGNHNIDKFFDQVFICPFELYSDSMINLKGDNSQGIQQQEAEIPIWMEKVQANKLSSKWRNLMRSGYSFSELFDQIKNYALDVTSKHEPYKMQETQQKLRNIKSFKELEQFIDKITNIDQRQQRKMKVRSFMNQNNQDNDDIFGSQEENINISQAQDQQLKSQQDEQEQQQEESQKQKSQQIQQQQSSEQQSEEDEDEQISNEQNNDQVKNIQAQRKQEYSFLQNLGGKKIYQKSKQLEQADSSRLDLMMKRQIKNKSKKLKYSSSYIKNTVNYQIKKSKQILKNVQQTKNIKKNLISTNMKYTTVPYKNKNVIKFGYNNKNAKQYIDTKKIQNIQKIQKIQNIKNISQYNIIDNSIFVPRFTSQMNDYQTSQIINQIKQIPKKLIQEQQHIQFQQQDNPQIQIIPIIKQQPSIILEPIKRIKPDILLDNRLRHISDLDIENQIHTLTTIFIKKNNSNLQSPFKIKIRTKSTSNLLKPLQSTQNSSDKSSSLLKQTPKTKKSRGSIGFQTLKAIKRQQIVQDRIFPNVSCFNRVCLNHTASNFLVSEPIKRKSELLVIEARKNLLHKGRGLQTYLSKKY